MLTSCISHVECLSVTCYSLFLSCAIMKNCVATLQHFALPVRACFDDQFTAWWVGRGGQTMRRSCVTLFFLWGCAEGRACNENREHSLSRNFCLSLPLDIFGMWAPGCTSECKMRGRMLTFCIKRKRKKVLSLGTP